jgi:beta-1,4-mannosyl-glycoprotein beta-1,4-N-acetylglucosaminyltransferase
MVYDCFQFFNELDILKIRLNVLSPVVDHFVITESSVTFSGKPKPLYFNDNKELFREFHDKIIHVVVTDTPNGPDTSPFDRDAFQKKARERGLSQCSKKSIVLYSDVDEIPNPIMVRRVIENFNSEKVYHFAQRQFYYFLNLEEISGKLLSFAGEYDNVKTKKWLGTYLYQLELLDKFSVEELRVNKSPEHSVRVDDGGWHFTYMGGDATQTVTERVAHKVKSAAHQEFNNRRILSGIEKNISKRRDLFGRRSKFERVNIDDSYPQYLRDNLTEFKHLILSEPPETRTTRGTLD